jgi:hypothetical protein
MRLDIGVRRAYLVFVRRNKLTEHLNWSPVMNTLPADLKLTDGHANELQQREILGPSDHGLPSAVSTMVDALTTLLMISLAMASASIILHFA